jgi:RNA polymerase sigma-70 factor (ECF subfamily)
MSERPATSNQSKPSADRLFATVVEQRVAQWRQLLDGIAHRHRLDRDELDEVEQDIRIRLWRLSEKAGALEQASSSYIYRAAMSAVTDLIRRRRSGARGRVAIADVEGELAPASYSPAEAELVAALARALDTLDVPRRVVVRLHLDGKDRDEIAAILGWSEAKVRNLLYRGLNDLREQLREVMR